MDVAYPMLESKIAMRGIKKSAIAHALGISGRALYNKMHGKTPFSWPEVGTIQGTFFPDVDKDELFATPSPPTTSTSA